MIVSTTAVVALGADAITSTQTQLDVERTEKSLTELNSKTALVALGQTDVQQVSLPASSASSYRVDEDAGWMNVSYRNTTSGNRTTVFNESMGEVAYRGSGETRLAYQGGGVWRSNGDGTSVMVSPPEFHYRDATLTLPLVTVSGDGLVRDRAVITPNRSERYFPNSTRNEEFTNPLENGKVNITVQSEYYRAWGTYFEERTDGEVTYYPDSSRVSIILKVPAGPRKVRNAVAATSDTGSIKLSGNDAFTDSYTSADGDGYDAAEAGDGGDLTTAGDITVTGSAELNGNITAGGRVEFSSNSMTFDGDRVEWAEAFDDKHGACSASCSDEQIASFGDTTNINSHVDTQVDDLSSSNDNAGTIADDGVIDGTEGTTTLSAGRYHVDRIDLSDDVEFDTTGGNVIIGVENYVSLNTGNDITVSGPNQVKIYIQGESAASGGSASGYHFFTQASDIRTTGGVSERSTQVWIYGKDHLQARMEKKGSDESRVTGVIYAPGGKPGTSRFEIWKSDLYGGVVTSEVELEKGGAVHFDQALKQERTIPKDTSVVAITYLHISTNDVNVTSS
uniref:DUF7289 family protein n=1 Tax=Haloarcula brevis TaxID=3111453 RepID=UPI00300F629D